MLDLFILAHTQTAEHLHQLLRAEQAHQIVLQGNIEAGFTRISLTSGTSSQLIVDTAGLMALGTDDLQTSGGSGLLVQLDIRTTAGHVGGNGHRSCGTCLGHDLRLQLMELGVQHLVLYALPAQHIAEKLGGLDGDGTHQHRLILLMSFLDLPDHSPELLFLGHVNRVFQIHTLHRTVGGNLHHIHAVDIPKLLLLGEGRTGHTGFLLIFIEEILEGDGGQRLAFPAYLHMLLGLDGLVQAVGIPASRHDTSRKFIYDQHLVVLHHIILITEHQIMGPQRQDNIMLNLQVLRIRQVLDVEEILHLLHALLGQVHHLILLIDNEVAGLHDFLAHDGVHLGHLAAGLAFFQLFCQNITDLIQLCGLSALSGNNQRGTGLVDQHRVHLVNDGIVQVSLHQLLFINHHVISQIVETILIVGHIGDITGILLSSLIVFHGVQDHAHGQAQKLMHLSHPLRVTLCQIVVDRHNMDAFSFQRVQIGRTGGYQRFSFTGFHLRDTALMKNNTADQLYPVVLHIQHPSGSLSDGGKSLRKQIIQSLALCQPLLELPCFILQLFIRQLHHIGAQRLDLVHQRHDALQLSGAVGSKYFLC